MKPVLFIIVCQLPFTVFCQSTVPNQWRIQCGASSNTLYQTPASFNLRYISPRFKWSYDEPTEEELKDPERFGNARLMMELIYAPPLKVWCSSFNAQYRLMGRQRLTLEIYGGLKFFFIPGEDFANLRPLRENNDIWYMNTGLILQLNLGFIAPFVDLGGDGIITAGTEFHFRNVYKKPKSRYKLKKKKVRT
jgi:hypothetical protein